MDALDYIPRLHQNRVTLFIYYSMRVLVLIAAFTFLWEGDMSSVGGCILVFALMILPSILKDRYRFYLPFALDLSIVVFIFGTMFLGHLLHFYELFPLWDKFLHFQSGLILSVTGFVLVYILNEQKSLTLDLSPGFIALFAIAFSISIGALWEIGEYTVDGIVGSSWSFSQADTIWDLTADSVGALLVSAVGYVWMHRRARLPFTPWRFSWWRKTQDYSANLPSES